MKKIVFMSGFEQNCTDMFDVVTGDVTISDTYAKTGTYSVRHEDEASVEIETEYTALAQTLGLLKVYLSVNVYLGDVYSGGGALRFFDVEFHLLSSEIIKIHLLGTNGYWDAYVDGDKVADGVIDAVDGWQNVQILIDIDDTNGTIQTIIDGDVDIIYDGDTQPGSSPGISKILISTDTDGASKYCYYDDLYISTDEWPGQVRIFPHIPVEKSGRLGETLDAGTDQGNGTYWEDELDGPASGYWNTAISQLQVENDKGLLTLVSGAYFAVPVGSMTGEEAGIVKGVKAMFTAKDVDVDSGSKVALYRRFIPSGARADEQEVYKTLPYIDINTTYQWFEYQLQTSTTGAPWKFDDFQYENFGVSSYIVGSKRVRVDYILIEVATVEFSESTPTRPETRWKFTHDGHLVTSWIHSGLMDVDKYFSAIKVFARNVNLTSSRIYVDYRTSRNSGWTIIEDNAEDSTGKAVETEDAQEISLYVSDRVVGKAIQLRLRFESEYANASPDMLSYLLETFPKIPRRRVFSCPIRIQANRQNVIGGITYESMSDYYDAIVAMVNTAEPYTVRSSNPVVDGLLVQVVGLSDERIISDPEDPDQTYIVATLSFLEVD